MRLPGAGRAGARGCLLKDVAVAELVIAVKTLVEGRIYVSLSVTDTLTYSFLSAISELHASRENQQQLLDEIQVKNRELERQNAELERFTYSVSLDLKAPLVTIKGFIGLLQRDLAASNADAVRNRTDQGRAALSASPCLALSKLPRRGRLADRNR